MLSPCHLVLLGYTLRANEREAKVIFPTTGFLKDSKFNLSNPFTNTSCVPQESESACSVPSVITPREEHTRYRMYEELSI